MKNVKCKGDFTGEIDIVGINDPHRIRFYGQMDQS